MRSITFSSDGLHSDIRPRKRPGPSSAVLLYVPVPQPSWGPATRVAFRFVFAYFAIYIPTYPTAGLLGYEQVQRYQDLWLKPAVYLSHHLLRVTAEVSTQTTQSGDRLCDYLFLFWSAALASVICLAWSVLDRRRTQYGALLAWLRFFVRVALGITLIVYGAVKVFPSQFPAPLLNTLAEPYGNSSPMALLWTFMGASAGYSLFAGSLEMLAGWLLLVPGCATLGGLLSMAVISNVFLLNMCYDVPVKLFSFHLLLFSIFLVAPDAWRLLKLFLLKRTIALRQDASLFRKPLHSRILLGLTFGLALLVSSTALLQSYQRVKTDHNISHETPYYGMWTVEEFRTEGTLRPPLLTDATRWRRLFIEAPEYAVVEPMDGPVQSFQLAIDKSHSILTIKRSGTRAEFTFHNPEPDILSLNGTMDGHAAVMLLHRARDPKFLLTSRGFHWVNEFPYVN